MSLRIRSPRALYLAPVALAAILLVRLGYEHFGPRLIINTTGSEPRGIYWLSGATPQSIRRSTLVALTVPRTFRELIEQRQWTRPGVQLLKNIGALAGDQVCVSKGRLSINGKAVAPVLSRDSLGRPLPQLHGCQRLAPGYFLPLSTYIPNSFDGRYMGQQPVALIQGVAHPLWIF